jgi:hypothetical protein
MSEFWIYLKIGLTHVLDLQGYDHVLFLVALTVPYAFKDWKRLLLLVSVFTIGHTLALLLSVYNVLMIRAEIVEFLIPITILVTAVYSIFTAGKAAKAGGASATAFITLFFGLVHGLGFSNYFKSILPGTASEKLLPLFEFAIGIELAQAIIVLAVLILGYILQAFFRVSRRDWILVTSALVAGIVIPLIAGREW